MSKKFKVWLDSGANDCSKYEEEVSLDDIGIDDVDWGAMSDDQKMDVMREVAFDKSDWGFIEVDA